MSIDDNILISPDLFIPDEEFAPNGEYIGKPCLTPDGDGLDCHSVSSDPHRWCASCMEFAEMIGSL